MVAHAFNPSTQEAEAGGFLSSRPAWSTEWVPGHSQDYTGKPCLENKKQKTNKKKIKAILYFKFMNIFLTMTQTWGIVFIWYVQSTWIILL